ncbi:hypothetical protein SYNTR_1697 [Candidatus Syntrophocurvum alkaliphilum]|uniref:SAF domain-containing protein n=1 Tax=Candidatus Syntrophocurvum alkaliphilum TaxID=2293317 RepID=A0A6I6DC94_9FIRM|nr:Flp pilus assembly protein CpaB [Candidatus Syntrophocurvum alkaliphilum]QGU00291.1 hypothetical protein SYNTR_1697 [Candidatus Syntrophocurvum alkaliphilum]
MENIKPRVWVIITVVIALITSLLIYTYLESLQAAEAVEKAEVVVASRILEEGTRINSDMLETVTVPVQYAHPEALTNTSDVVNKYAAVNLYPEQAILGRQLVSHDSREMPFRIPEDMRAITIDINTTSGVAGFIKPGYKVDIIYTVRTENDETRTVTLLDEILVLAVGEEITKVEDNMSSSNVTLAVKPDDAQLITLAENTGNLKLSLRPIEDNTQKPTTFSDVRRILNNYQ